MESSRIWTISGGTTTFLILLFDFISRVKKLIDGNGLEEIIEADGDDDDDHFVDDDDDDDKLEMKFVFKFLPSNNKNEVDGFLSESDFPTSSQTQTDFLSETDFIQEDEPQGIIPSSSKPPECVWEHQELIDQLKMELRKVKATTGRRGGLPTILEEPDEPPFKIGTAIDDELHTFYKRYTEAMRQFDILNYQKMYAMGFLDHEFQSELKPPPLKSLVSHNLWLLKHRTHGSNPIKKLINELQGDLEVVYVGQICTTWEFLNLQYKRALELWAADPHGIHRHYSQVGGEFRHFQALIQRFLEDERLGGGGPRVESYVKSRCVLRNLLQVPMIREDDDRRRKEEEGKWMTSRGLVETIEESIATFWGFLESDPDWQNQKKKKKTVDNKGAEEVRKLLEKKERKVRRRGGDDDGWDEGIKFLWEVELKLVNRALRLQRINGEQLAWCRNKLSTIGGGGGRGKEPPLPLPLLFLKPSFFAFPL